MTNEHDSAAVAATSLLGNGEVCAARVAQPPRVNTDARMVPAGVVGDSISGKQGTREDGRPAGAGREFMVATICAGRARPAGVRAAVGAEKRGNARRAKGGREAEARERGGCHISRYRLPGRARKPEAKPAPIRREFACQHHRVAGAGGRSWITLRRGAGPCREATCQSESRVREIRTHGSEGGAAQTNASSLPLSAIPAPPVPVFPHWSPAPCPPTPALQLQYRHSLISDSAAFTAPSAPSMIPVLSPALNSSHGIG